MEKLETKEKKEGNEIEDDGKDETHFHVYRKRWLVMVNLALLNFSVATIWLGFSPVAYKASVYYNTSVSTINWLSIGINVISILFGLLWSWVMNKIGLKICMLLCAWSTVIGAGLRICSTIDGVSNAGRLIFLFLGQYMVGIVQPLGIYCAPKLAAIWFPSRQRSVATTVSGMANPVGIVLTGIISPLFVDSRGILNTRYMLIAYTCTPVVCALMTSLVMTSDGPPTPPSYGSTRTTSSDFFQGVKKILCIREYVILMVAVGSGIGLYSSFATLGEQVLCPWGYSDTIVGVCSSVMTGAGLIGAVVTSIIVDRTKRFSEALKVMFISAALATIVFTVTHKIYMGYLIAMVMGILGFLAFGISPIGMETGAEVTFPVGVSIGTAMIQISGQVLSAVMILVLQSVGRPMSREELVRSGSKCHFSLQSTISSNITTSEPEPIVVTYDLTVSTYIISGIMVFVALSFLIFFKPTYRRMNAETEDERIRNSGLSISSSRTTVDGEEISNGTVASDA